MTLTTQPNTTTAQPAARCLIADAVEPLRLAAIEDALAAAEKYITSVTEHLDAHGGDFTTAYPYPSPHSSRREYSARMKIRTKAGSLVKTWVRDPAEYNVYGLEERLRQHHVVVDPNRVLTFFANTAVSVSVSFDAYIKKLRSKIGDVTKASCLSSADVWGQSYLTVSTPAGEEIWKTQRVLNVSSLGQLFNQWPTRRLAR